MNEFGRKVLGRTDGKWYKTILCSECGDPMELVSKNYIIDEWGLKHFTDSEILLFNICEKCRIQKPIQEGQKEDQSSSSRGSERQ